MTNQTHRTTKRGRVSRAICYVRNSLFGDCGHVVEVRCTNGKTARLHDDDPGLFLMEVFGAKPYMLDNGHVEFFDPRDPKFSTRPGYEGPAGGVKARRDYSEPGHCTKHPEGRFIQCRELFTFPSATRAEIEGGEVESKPSAYPAFLQCSGCLHDADAFRRSHPSKIGDLVDTKHGPGVIEDIVGVPNARTGPDALAAVRIHVTNEKGEGTGFRYVVRLLP